MQVRQILVASLLAVAAAGAMSQEIDASETLQGKSLAAQQDKAAQARDSATESAGAEAPAARVVADSRHAQGKTRAHGRFDLTRWHPAYKAAVGAVG